MPATPDQIATVLRRFNPWWEGRAPLGLPTWRRTVFKELYTRLTKRPVARAVGLMGLRRVGKTTLLLQAISELLARGEVQPNNLLYVELDQPLLSGTPLSQVVDVWRSVAPKADGGPEYLFLDEVQALQDWGKWIKWQDDYHPHQHIAFTGSVLPLARKGHESGVGRWWQLQVPTLLFDEYLQVVGADLPALPQVARLRDLFAWEEGDFRRTAALAEPLQEDFGLYLLRGGFPHLVQVPSLVEAQRHLREEVLQRAVMIDLPQVSGVRQTRKLVDLLSYLCQHEGGLLNASSLASAAELTRATVQGHLELLEAAHLIHLLPAFGSGKERLSGRPKVYLADPGMAPAVLLRGELQAEQLGTAAEATVFRHLHVRCLRRVGRLSSWRDGGREVDFVVRRDESFSDRRAGQEYAPLEVKYRRRGADTRDLAGLLAFCAQHGARQAYVVTRYMEDFGPFTATPRGGGPPVEVMRIPAPLFCYWLGQSL